jgi:hypothetical protein
MMDEEGDGLTKVQLPDGEAVAPEEQFTAIIGRMAPRAWLLGHGGGRAVP